MYKISHENNPDIILVKDLLPSKIISKIWVDLEKLKPFFGPPHWTKRQLNPIDKCQGEDIWLHHPFKKNIPELKGIKLLDKFFFHQGITNYIMKNGLNIFRYLVHDFWEKKGYSIHIVSYGNNGYYNWHSDGGIYYNGLGLPALWTFALTLIKDPSKVSGGNQLIMEKDKTIRIPLENNSLVIFPSYTFHSMTELKSIDNNELPWENRRFNIQFWTMILPKFEDEIVQEIPY